MAARSEAKARHEEGVLSRAQSRGPELHYYAVLPEGAPRAKVGLLHGYAEYGKRYSHVADAWAERGIATFAIDLRGHGLSGGTRGHCESFREFLDDAAELSRLVQDRVPGTPAFLFGHSFGGLVAASMAVEHPAPWRGLLLSGPYIGLALDVPRLKVIAGKVASRLVPTFAQPSGLRGADMTHDAARARAYDADPLIFKGITARWFTEASGAQDRLLARAPALTMPLYLVMGAQDRVAKVARARAFFDAVGSPDKTWDERPGLFHEVLNEPEWRSIADRLSDWMLDHAR
jgi:alpha-beta hydrolase superfamily lysophospholipase